MVLSFAFILLVSLSGLAQSQVSDSVYDRAAAAFQTGKMAEAEETLRSILRSSPGDVRALGMLGVVLDAQKRFDEAERYYVQALRLAPGAAGLHNNMGNHYLARGMSERARTSFQKALSLDPHHPNANLHLAQMSVDEKEGQVALRCLDRLPAAEQMTPAVQLLRAQALYLAGKKESSEALLTELAKQASGDSRLAFSIGM